MTSQLFTPVQIGKRTLSNRITVAPMCQYSAVDGSMGNWHLMHLGSLAISGASMLVMEATGVTPEGRITPYCPGLYSDANEAAMSKTDMAALKQAFVQAAQRAARIGLDFIELHSTHGYLLSEFLSPLANRRIDEYGGSLENRMRFPLEVFRAIRDVFPADRPVGAKISGSDFVEGGFTPDDAVVYARALKREVCAYVTVSGGGVVLDAKIPVGPGYQVPFAERVKKETGIVTGAVGMITDPQQAEAIIANGQADFISLARAMLFNPRWPQHAAVALGVEVPYPPQYERAAPKAWRPGRTLGKLG
ncbi:MAG: NADH:flavin oxidoreductase [Proteobacteria bacterium]|nr:NADH:flavin oxidoreductase [Pseudomonadota bacterium]